MMPVLTWKCLKGEVVKGKVEEDVKIVYSIQEVVVFLLKIKITVVQTGNFPEPLVTEAVIHPARVNLPMALPVLQVVPMLVVVPFLRGVYVLPVQNMDVEMLLLTKEQNVLPM